MQLTLMATRAWGTGDTTGGGAGTEDERWVRYSGRRGGGAMSKLRHPLLLQLASPTYQPPSCFSPSVALAGVGQQFLNFVLNVFKFSV